MFYKRYLWLLVILAVEGSDPRKDSYQLLIDLFVDSELSFEYEFGSGVPLLAGKATVTLSTPLELSPNSSVSYPDNFTQLCSLDIKVVNHITVSQENRPDLVLSGCKMELDVTARNDSDWRIEPVVGLAVPLPEHSLLQRSDPSGARADPPDAVSGHLPETALELFKKEFDESEDIKSDPSHNFNTFKEMFPVLMYLKGRPIANKEQD